MKTKIIQLPEKQKKTIQFFSFFFMVGFPPSVHLTFRKNTYLFRAAEMQALCYFKNLTAFYS